MTSLQWYALVGGVASLIGLLSVVGLYWCSKNDK